MAPLKLLQVQLRQGTHPFRIRPDTSDELLASQIFVQRLLDLSTLRRGPEIAATYRRIEATGKTPLIVDAGAYIGATAVFFHALFPEARIVALEPERSNFEMLAQNAAGIGQIEPRQSALCGEPGWVRVSNPKLGYGHLAFQVAPAGEDGANAADCVRATTLPEILDGFGASGDLFIVKIDTEGSEKEIFRGLAAGQDDWIDRTPILIVEPHDWLYGKEGRGQSVIDALAGRDRDLIIHGENLVSLSNSLVRTA